MEEAAEAFFIIGYRPVINHEVMNEIYLTHPEALQRAFLFSKLANLQPPLYLSTMYYSGQAKRFETDLPTK